MRDVKLPRKKSKKSQPQLPFYSNNFTLKRKAMAYEAQGRIVEIFDTIQRSDTLRFREFLIETSEEGRDRTYTHILKFQLKNEKIELLDLHKPESVVKVNFNIRSSRWERNGQVSYITNLDAWKIVQITLPADPQASKPANMPTSEGIDDLPF